MVYVELAVYKVVHSLNKVESISKVAHSLT